MRAVTDVSDVEGRAKAAERRVSLTAQAAIVLYQGVDHGSRGGTGMLAVHHEVEPHEGDEQGAPVLRAGRPLDRGALDLIIRQLSEQEAPRQREMIPSDLLYADPDRMVWHVPARILPMWFRTEKKDWDAKMSGNDVLWPPMLFVAEKGALRVYALAKSCRPLPNDPVYYVPLYNFYASGSMCAGNIRLPDSLSITGRDRWEQAVYETEFTHSNYHATRYVAHPRGHDGLWWEMRWRQMSRGFPVRYLVPVSRNATSQPRTVAEVIE